jgi:hypothetical protein
VGRRHSAAGPAGVPLITSTKARVCPGPTVRTSRRTCCATGNRTPRRAGCAVSASIRFPTGVRLGAAAVGGLVVDAGIPSGVDADAVGLVLSKGSGGR